MMIKYFTIAAAATLSSLAFTGCGFTPLHADYAQKGGSLSQVAVIIDDVQSQGARDDRLEFLLTQAMRDRLAAPRGNAAYVLELSPKLSRQGIGVRQDDVATRVDLVLDVKYVLRHSATGDEIDSGTVRTISTYSAPNNPYAVTTALEDAEERVARDAADRLVFDTARALNTR